MDTISKPGFTKTAINKLVPKKKEVLTEEEKEKRMKEFIKENEKVLKQYGVLRKYDDSKRFLQEHYQLVCEDTANYLVIWCINLEMEEVRSFLITLNLISFSKIFEKQIFCYYLNKFSSMFHQSII